MGKKVYITLPLDNNQVWKSLEGTCTKSFVSNHNNNPVTFTADSAIDILRCYKPQQNETTRTGHPFVYVYKKNVRAYASVSRQASGGGGGAIVIPESLTQIYTFLQESVIFLELILTIEKEAGGFVGAIRDC